MQKQTFERKNICIDIIASCVCRDAFVIGASSVATNKYIVKSNFQYNSILSYMSKKNENLAALVEDDFCFGTPWQRRMLSADLKKDVFSKIYAENSFIILDITSVGLKHFDISIDEISLFTSTKVSRPNLPVIEKALGFSPKKIDPWDLSPEYINDAVERYASQLASVFPSGKIIFTEVLNAREYVTKSGTLAAFANGPEIKKKNAFLKKIQKLLCEKLQEHGSPAHFIPMPEGVLGFEAHKWGKYSLHFCDEYYEYLIRAYDTVCSEYSAEDTAEIISELKTACESRFATVRERALATAAHLSEIEELRSQILRTSERENALKSKLDGLCKKYKTKDLEKYVSQLVRQNKRLKNELNGTRASISFKVGRFITFIPRKILRKK